jgi:hypothetical protein
MMDEDELERILKEAIVAFAWKDSGNLRKT